MARPKSRVISKPRAARRSPILIIVALAALDVGAYARVGHQGYSMLDDPIYVSYNPTVAGGLSWTSFAWAWTTFHGANWHPITWLSHLIDASLFGSDPGPQHLVSLAIHIVNTVLLFLGLSRLTRDTGASAVVAALFGVHPINVESVVWLAERKNVLSTLFWWASVWAYVRYVRRPDLRGYLLLTICFALGLMAKPMLVTLPLTLLILDVWPLERASWPWLRAPDAAATPWPRLIREKIPLAIVAAASALITVVAQSKGGAIAALDRITLGQRMANAVVSTARYLEHAVWPFGLSVFYPYPAHIDWTAVAASGVLIAVLSAAAWKLAATRPFVLAGWLWFLVTLAPVIGIVQVGRQAMADRYGYVPLVGVFVAAVFGARSLAPADVRAGRIRLALASVVVVAFAIAASVQTTYWDSTERLLEHAVAVDPDNGTALHGLAGLVARNGRQDE